MLSLLSPSNQMLIMQDFDGGIVGQTVTQVFLDNTGLPTQLSWFVVPASQFPGGVEEVSDAIAQNKAWAAVTSASTFF